MATALGPAGIAMGSVIFASTDADDTAEMQIGLTGSHQLTASDFIL